MKKPFPRQQNYLISLQRGEEILKNQFGITLFPITVNRDSSADRIANHEPGAADELMHSAYEGRQQIASLYHFVVGLIDV